MSKREDRTIRELKRKLTLYLLGIFGFLIAVILAFAFFGPQIGSLFGFISKNRNTEMPEAQVTLSPPSFVSIPKATNKDKLTVEGYSTSGTTIKLFVNGPEKAEAVTGGDGKFVFENVELIEGRNSVFAKAISQKGDSDVTSETFYIELDKNSPKIEILSPKNGDKVQNLNNRVLIKGKISEEAKIRINGKLAVQQPDLSFEFLLGVTQGELEIKVVATDLAGNEKEEKVFINYVND